MRKLNKIKEKVENPIWFRDMSKKNTERVLDIIKKKDWSNVLIENRPCFAFEMYFTELQSIINENFPLKIKKTFSKINNEKP